MGITLITKNGDITLTKPTGTGGGTVDLSNYYTKEQVNTMLAEVDGDIEQLFNMLEVDYATIELVEDKIAAIPKPDMSEYAKKTDIPDVSKFITEIPVEYVTQQDLWSQGFLTGIPEEYITEDELSTAGFLTVIPDEYITEAELNEAIAKIDVGGGTVAVDGITIVQDENGVISTSLGGGVANLEPTIIAQITEPAEQTFVTNGVFRITVPNGLSSYEKGVVYYVKFAIKGVTYYDTCTSANGNHMCEATGTTPFLRMNGNTAQFNLWGTVDEFIFSSTPFVSINYIDTTCIPIDNTTIVVGANGLETTFSGTEDSAHNVYLTTKNENTNIQGSNNIVATSSKTISVSTSTNNNFISAFEASLNDSDYSTISGYRTQADYAQGCHVEGYGSKVSNWYTNTMKGAHAEGYYTYAASDYQHVQGRYNVADASRTYAHIVGNGTAEDARSNAHTLDWSGNAWFAGNITVGENNDVLATESYVTTAIQNALSAITDGDEVSY